MATIGIKDGLVTIIMKLAGHDEPNWGSLPLYLPSPWCYVIATAIIVAALLGLVARDKTRLASAARASDET